VLDKAIYSRSQEHAKIDTAELDIVYRAVERVEETGVGHPLPPRTTDQVWSFGNADRDANRKN